MLTLRALTIMLIVGVFGAMSALQHVAGRRDAPVMVAMSPASPDRHQDEQLRHTAFAACLTVCVGASQDLGLTLIASDLNYRLFDPVLVGRPTVTKIGTPPPERPPQAAHHLV